MNTHDFSYSEGVDLQSQYNESLRQERVDCEAALKECKEINDALVQIIQNGNELNKEVEIEKTVFHPAAESLSSTTSKSCSIACNIL